MTSEQVDTMLTNYKEYAARCGHLRIRLAELQKEKAMHERSLIDDQVRTTSVVSDMPRGGRTSDPTGQLGTRLAAGFVPEHIKEIQDDIDAVLMELDEKEPTVLFVDAWLNCLTEREALVVRGKFFEGMSYADVIEEFNRTFGKFYSKTTIKTMLKNAMQKIYEIAV